MTRRSREEDERAEYDRLHAKYGRQRPARARRSRDENDEDGEDTDGVYVLAGKHADNFLDRMFGPRRDRDEDDEDDDEDQADEDDDEDQADEPDPAPARASNRYFRSRTPRG